MEPKKSTLMYSVAGGVVVDAWCSQSCNRLRSNESAAPTLHGCVVLTVFSTEEFVNVAWDSAGVTTGPVTVPWFWPWTRSR